MVIELIGSGRTVEEQRPVPQDDHNEGNDDEPFLGPDCHTAIPDIVVMDEQMGRRVNGMAE